VLKAGLVLGGPHLITNIFDLLDFAQPVAVAIEAYQYSVMFYAGGILSVKDCGEQLDHGLLAVGYGTDAKTKTKYWIVKNSWGITWGDRGYMLLERHHGSQISTCGIAKEASYPVV